MRGAVLRRELTAVGLSLLAAFLLGALIFQRVPDPGSCWDATGVFGPVGTVARCTLVVSVGMPGAALIAIGCLVMALRIFGKLSRESDAPEWGVLFAGIVLLVPIAIGLALGGPSRRQHATQDCGVGLSRTTCRKAHGARWCVDIVCVGRERVDRCNAPMESHSPVAWARLRGVRDGKQTQCRFDARGTTGTFA